MKSKKPNLIVVAHPDDETIFFAGLIQSRPAEAWRVICVTDGNADGQGAQRESQLRAALKTLKVNNLEILKFPDRFESRLDLDALVSRLQQEVEVKAVYTHSILGDYGHPHHQDVSYACHQRFVPQKVPVWSVAYNCFPERVIRLTPAQYKKKGQILSSIYLGETERFAHLLPLNAFEGFVRVPLKEIEALYRYFREQTPIDQKDLKVYRWFQSYLPTFRDVLRTRPF